MTEAEPQHDDPSFTSLATLRAHQRDLRRDLMDGFADRTELLLWQHDVAAKTIGQIPDDWHTKFVADRWLTASMMADVEARKRVSPKPPDASTARRQRSGIRQDDLMPAMQAAIREFRQLAGEYVEDVENPVNMGRQRFLAMRPRLDEVVGEQREALEWALGRHESRPPIADRDGALEWADQVIYATYGFIGDEFTDEVTAISSEWLPALRHPDRFSLKMLLATDILPVMNRTIRYVVRRATEASSEDHDPLEPIQG